MNEEVENLKKKKELNLSVCLSSINLIQVIDLNFIFSSQIN